MDEARGIDHQLKASSESTIDIGSNGSNGVDDDDRENERCNKESQQENSIQNVNLHFPIII